jgi:hypothetical protein
MVVAATFLRSTWNTAFFVPHWKENRLTRRCLLFALPWLVPDATVDVHSVPDALHPSDNVLLHWEEHGAARARTEQVLP